jgi:hypothetical protein
MFSPNRLIKPLLQRLRRPIAETSPPPSGETALSKPDVAEQSASANQSSSQTKRNLWPQRRDADGPGKVRFKTQRLAVSVRSGLEWSASLQTVD